MQNLFTYKNIFLVALFLLFFPIYTQFYNIIQWLFDIVFTGGKISEIYTYNFTGHLLGCQEVLLLQKYMETFNYFQTNGLLFIKCFISLGCGLMLIYKAHKLSFYKRWFLLFVFSFFLFFALEYFINTFINGNFQLSLTRPIMFILSGITLLLSIFIFLRCFNSIEKVQLAVIAFPSALLSLFLWYHYFGPILLPIQTLV